MDVAFKRGQIWEDGDGCRIRIVDEKVESRTEVYLAPVKLEVEPVGTDIPTGTFEDITVDTNSDSVRVSRDTLLCECDLVDE